MGETGISYGRASRDHKHVGTSVDDQLKENARWALAHGVVIIHTIRDDDRSAGRTAKREREGFRQVMKLVQSRAADMLIVWESSRAARDLAEFASLMNLCEDVGMLLVLGGQRLDMAKAEDRMMAAIGGMISDAEARRIAARNQRTVRLNAEAGRPHGPRPYGFRREYDPDTGRLVTQTPYVPHGPGDPPRLTPEAQIIRDASRDLLAGDTLRAVCRRLNAAGIPSPRRPRKSTPEPDYVTTWETSTLRQLLLKPANAGLRQYQGKIVGKAVWAPIIPEGEWLRLRALLTDPKRRSSEPRGTDPRHLLSGIAVCGECGARLKAATNITRMPRAYVCRKEGCMRVTVSADRADEVVLGVLYAYLRRPDVVAAIASRFREQDDHGGARAEAANLAAVLQTRLDEAAVAFSDGQLSAAMLGKIEADLLPKIESAREAAVPTTADPSVGRLLRAHDIVAAFDSAPLLEQRAVVRSLLRVTLNRAVVRGRNFDQRRVVVEAAGA